VGKPLVRFCEGLDGNFGMDEIVWHRRETRRQTENTKRILQPGESPAYSNSPENGGHHRSCGYGGYSCAPNLFRLRCGRCRPGRNEQVHRRSAAGYRSKHP